MTNGVSTIGTKDVETERTSLMTNSYNYQFFIVAFILSFPHGLPTYNTNKKILHDRRNMHTEVQLFKKAFPAASCCAPTVLRYVSL